MGLIEHIGRLLLRIRGYRSHWIDVQSGPVHFMDRAGEGELPPFMLLHGLGSCSVHYGPLLRHLRPLTKKVQIIDFPGHGFSRVPGGEMTPELFRDSVAEAMDAIITEPVVLYGNSMGGLAALRYALLRPERVRALILCSPGGAPMATAELEALFTLFSPGSHEASLEFVDRLFARRYSTRHLFALGVRRTLNNPLLQGLLRSLDEETMLTAEEVSKLKVPTLCIWGKEDGILPRTSLGFFLEHLPKNVRFMHPESFGHSPHLEFPAVVAEKISHFVLDGV